MGACRYYSDADLAGSWDGDVASMVSEVERALLAWRSGDVLLPDKSSQIIDAAMQNRVNVMPATLLADGVSGVKMVSVFPGNAGGPLPNVSGAVCACSSIDGSMLYVCEAGFVTALRTALVSGTAARRLAARGARTVGLIGSGEQARMHLAVLSALLPGLEECKVASRNPASADAFEAEMSPVLGGVSVRSCGSDYAAACSGADVIVTAISGQAAILKGEWVKPGCLYIHVGGLEDEYSVALKSDLIVCDCWEAVKHRTQTLSRMYRDGMLSDADIHADLADIVSGDKPGRTDGRQIAYFNSVGLAFIDLAVCDRLVSMAAERGLGIDLPCGGGGSMRGSYRKMARMRLTD